MNSSGVERRFRWYRRDWLAAICLFLATAAVILWQNAHVAVLWDLSYVLDSAMRISQGQVPYRDFPFAHAPLTFLIQAAIIHCAGRVFFHHVLYCAICGASGTVLTWRIVLRSITNRPQFAWPLSLALCVPLVFLGIYCVFPHPSYDCDCILAILCSIALLQRLTIPSPSVAVAVIAGAMAVIPVFFKQNIGLAFIVSVLFSIAVLMAVRLVHKDHAGQRLSIMLAVLLGMGAAVALAALLLHMTAGIYNYLHWTIGFAAQRRMPGPGAMLDVYREPALLWMLPCVVVGVTLLKTTRAVTRWLRLLATALLAAPFLWTIAAIFLHEEADERGDALLALWPLLLIVSALLAVVKLRRNVGLREFLPVIVLFTINGSLMSQQLWGSTYAIWPLLILLIPEIILLIEKDCAALGPALATCATVSVCLLVCGSLYTISEERLSYIDLAGAASIPSTVSSLGGMTSPGPYLPQFEELLRFADTHIPAADGVVMIPGEDPFYFATGRSARFPVLLFDPATQPYSPPELAQEVRRGNIRWLVIKRNLQIREDPTPGREAVLGALIPQFALDAQLQGYSIYRRR